MNLQSGTRLGPYEMVSRLGAGGMGEVWRATDSRLDRDVAIKILSEDLSRDEVFRARFDREARAISSLNHPNICTLFDVGAESDAHFLVMELIEGESLADRIERGPLPMDQVLRYGAQIADALDRAHRQGIVHRDLKPGNVMIAKTGAKLLDFGLARASVSTAPVRGLTELPTQARPLTREGTILGTFQYMAPEQLEGHEADARTDIFSLGALLYEMATGKRAFEAASRTSLIAAIVSSHPVPISEVAPLAPPALDHVVRKCMEKDPEDRWQSAHDVAGELRWITEAGSKAGVAAPITLRRKSRERLAWFLAGLTLVALVVAGWLLSTKHEAPRNVMESSIAAPAGLRVASSGGVSISPDGRNALFVFVDDRGEQALWVRPLDSNNYRQLVGTGDATHPFWSPDSRRIGFFAGGKLKIVDAQDGAVRTVCDAADGRGGSWNGDGTILFAAGTAGPLLKVAAAGGVPKAITALRKGDVSHRWPFFLPDGRTFLFMVQGDVNEICLSSIDRPQEIRSLTAVRSAPLFVPPDVLVYLREAGLVAQRFDAKRARMIGEPVVLAERIGLTDRSSGLFSAASDGTLLFQRGAAFRLSQLTLVDRSGKVERVVTETGLFFSPALSHDGRRIAVDVSNDTNGQGDIWVYDLARGTSSRLTFHPANESAPHWFPDDKRIAYFSLQSGGGEVFEIPAGGTGEAALLVADNREKRPSDVSSDGRWIVFNATSQQSGSGMDIWVYSTVEKKARPWLATPFTEACGRLSPDGKWIAYNSDESGRNEVYVRAFPDSDAKWMVSNGGGITPTWRGDGKEIFYVAPDRKIVAVPVQGSGESFEVGAPVRLFEARLRTHTTIQYDVTPDGQHFLLNGSLETAAAEPVSMLQNWDLKLPPAP